ncbi:hypothetical protein APA_292 [Pseudanabaena sp. lw0831]|nr:hypothetical protein APA_292 [Pseudanabaena sp. lw0831]
MRLRRNFSGLLSGLHRHFSPKQSIRRNQYYSTYGSRQALLTKVSQKFLN